MFTGIIQATAPVRSLRAGRDAFRLELDLPESFRDVREGDSVAVNGVCLTVSGGAGKVVFDVVRNTMERTNLKRLGPGHMVNLEKAVAVGDLMSGHIVTGHVDSERTIRDMRPVSKGIALDISLSREDRAHLIPRGSVAVDGISLTVAEVARSFFRVYVIPHTFDNTTLCGRKAGDMVNVELDIMSRYAAGAARPGEGLTMDVLKDNGFL